MTKKNAPGSRELGAHMVLWFLVCMSYLIIKTINQFKNIINKNQHLVGLKPCKIKDRVITTDHCMYNHQTVFSLSAGGDIHVVPAVAAHRCAVCVSAIEGVCYANLMVP